MTNEMLITKDVVKNFGNFCALDGASIRVPKGSVYGLVGPNGAGKSTLLRHVMGILRPDEGEVYIDGESVWENDVLMQRVAFIPDELFYFPNATIQDMRQYYRGLYPRFDDKRFETLHEVFSTIDNKRPVRRLSKGMQKQSIFWLSLCCHPDFLVLDEPVDGLDPVMRHQIWSLLMNDVVEQNTTILVSSHNLRELEDVCDHVGIMHKGKILLQRSLEELEGSVSKVQVAFANQPPAFPEDIKIMHHEKQGHVHTLIVRGKREQLVAHLTALHPLFLDVLPLTLEEIFIYEMGGVDYGIKDILA